MRDRAAQFSAFRALSGYEDAIRETARRTMEKIKLDACEIAALNEKLQLLQERLAERPKVQITYFVPDTRKPGGIYQTVSGTVVRIDAQRRALELADGGIIPIDQIYRISFNLNTLYSIF